jgi:hypothetical protein
VSRTFLRFVLDRTPRNRYDSAVRRAPAILLLGIFGFSLIAPVLAADSASKLPACCRRDGQHRCAMTGTRSEVGALIQAVCPAYPKTGATPAYSKTAVAGLCQVVAGPTASESTYRAQTAVLAHSSFSRTRQKRGPPKRIS